MEVDQSVEPFVATALVPDSRATGVVAAAGVVFAQREWLEGAPAVEVVPVDCYAPPLSRRRRLPHLELCTAGPQLDMNKLYFPLRSA
jgi:membrane protein YdbS with pleckstrin-like domain